MRISATIVRRREERVAWERKRGWPKSLEEDSRDEEGEREGTCGHAEKMESQQDGFIAGAHCTIK